MFIPKHNLARALGTTAILTTPTPTPRALSLPTSAWALAKEKASEGAALAWPVLEKVADSVARVLGHNDAADAHSKTMERVEELTGVSMPGGGGGNGYVCNFRI